jgi:nicotinate-nucleotide adenylyltransferase
MARLGLFGGTFDPPHLGHLILAAEAYQQLRLDRVLWILTPDPPHKLKREITTLQHRLDLLYAAISSDANFELCMVDIERPGPHYAIDTVRILQQQQPEVDFIYLMGGDSLMDLHTWRNHIELVEIISALAVMIRTGEKINLADLESKTPGLSAKVQFINAPRIGISASDIRQRVANGLPFRYLVPSEVYKLIRDRGLYRIT